MSPPDAHGVSAVEPHVTLDPRTGRHIDANNPNNWIPLNSSRIQMTPAYEEQVRFGVQMMLRKIKQAVGETTSF